MTIIQVQGLEKSYNSRSCMCYAVSISTWRGAAFSRCSGLQAADVRESISFTAQFAAVDQIRTRSYSRRETSAA